VTGGSSRSMKGCIRRWACRYLFGAIVSAFACGSACGEPADAEQRAAPDSARSLDWSALYRNNLALSKSSTPFPWNDESVLSHVNDRLALLGAYRPGDGVTAFAKGATGFRLGGTYHETQFVLEEWHLAVSLMKGSFTGRLFSREKVFRTDNRLLEILSNDAPFIEGRGDGLRLDVTAGPLNATYLESFLRSTADIERPGGLPLFRGGGDTYRLVRLELRDAERGHLGGMLSQTRTTVGEDAIMAASDVALRVFGVELMAELARSSPGSWAAFGGGSLFDLRPRELALDRISDLFSENDAFGAEADLMHGGSARLGSLGLVGGYRFCGSRFVDPQGELEPGLSETYMNAWWKHPKYDAMASVEATDWRRRGEPERRGLVGCYRVRYRGGFELRQGILCMTNRRCATVVSLVDENRLSRILTTARLDDLGERNDLSFYAEGGMNLGASVTATGALYLYRSMESFYNIGLEFRPRERFLLRAAVGSFTPALEDVELGRPPDLEPPLRDRTLLLFARVWFGSI
jgi:hypothetical protein